MGRSENWLHTKVMNKYINILRSQVFPPSEKWVTKMQREKVGRNPVVLSLPGTWILISKYHSPWKGTRIPWRMFVPGLGQRKYKMNLEHLFACQKVRKLKEWWQLIKMTPRSDWGASTGQSIKINHDSKELSPLNKIRTNETILTQINKWINKREKKESSSLQQNAN